MVRFLNPSVYPMADTNCVQTPTYGCTYTYVTYGGHRSPPARSPPVEVSGRCHTLIDFCLSRGRRHLYTPKRLLALQCTSSCYLALVPAEVRPGSVATLTSSSHSELAPGCTRYAHFGSASAPPYYESLLHPEVRCFRGDKCPPPPQCRNYSLRCKGVWHQHV